MKKILLFLLLIPTIVTAKLTDENIKTLELKDIKYYMASSNLDYIDKEDYLILPTEQGIYKYNKITSEITSLSLGNWDTTITPIGDNYIVVAREYDNSASTNRNRLVMIDKNLKIIKEKEIEPLGEYIFYSNVYNDNGTIFITDTRNNYYTIDEELNITKTTTKPSTSKRELLNKEYQELLSKEDPTITFIKAETNDFDTIFVLTKQYYEENTKEKVELREYKKDQTLINKKTLYDGEAATGFRSGYVSYKKIKIEDYFVEAYSFNGIVYINIYDSNNNLIKEINDYYAEKTDAIELQYNQNKIGEVVAIEKINNGFLLITSTFTTNYPISAQGIKMTENESLQAKGIVGTTFFLTYTLDYNIKIKTDNNGTISSSKDNASEGDEITFVITPNEGYVLSQVKVTDNEGNVLIFKENTFTMPNADVIIEATFNKIPEEKNPDTSDITIVLCILIITIGTIITYINIKKAQELL